MVVILLTPIVLMVVGIWSMTYIPGKQRNVDPKKGPFLFQARFVWTNHYLLGDMLVFWGE